MSATITITHDGQTQTVNPGELNELDDGIQRISNAFFARKRVTNDNDILTVAFEQLNEGILGRNVYLVIETSNMAGLSLDVTLKPADNTLTGGTDALELMQSGAATTIFKTTVGDFTALNNTSGTHDHYTHLDTLRDKAIIRLDLRPQATATFNTWATNIGAATAGLRIEIERSDKQKAAFRNEADEKDGPFPFPENPFPLSNKNVFEVFHSENQYNTYSQHNGSPKKIGKIANAATDQIKYFYHSNIDNEIELATSTLQTVDGRANGREVPALPPGHTSEAPAPAGGNAITNYYYEDNRIVTYGNYPGVAYVSYAASGSQVTLIRMPDSRNINEQGVVISYTFSGTQRRYCNPECFAGFMVALGECNFAVASTGMCFGDATSYPSLSHPNGDSIDTAYLGDTPTQRTRQQTLLNAFVAAGFSQVIAGTSKQSWLTGAHMYNTHHNNHLHSGNFSNDYVETLIG
ncbi:hypothetical protein [Taibaiella koreensis]|uniref:hypothetical protein n=1 Tax=Taibaiella koreensis TaxID=1268548 RepID=UPI000E59A45B|nr:hypothetical protein [Taibaiella koreensis]